MGASGRGSGGPVVEVGSRVRFEGRTWSVAALAGGQVRLVAEDGEMAALLLALLFSDEEFEVVDLPPLPLCGCRSWVCWTADRRPPRVAPVHSSALGIKECPPRCRAVWGP